MVTSPDPDLALFDDEIEPGEKRSWTPRVCTCLWNRAQHGHERGCDLYVST
jgi:hypothetical protein